MCWEYIETQFSAFQRAYIYYRDSEYAFGETRIKLITRIKEMHYMLWGLDILINEYSIHYRQFVFIIDTVEENLGNDWSLLFYCKPMQYVGMSKLQKVPKIATTLAVITKNRKK